MFHGVRGHATPSRLSADDARQVAQTMQALATPSRVRILACLREGPAAVGDLAEPNPVGLGVDAFGEAIGAQVRLDPECVDRYAVGQDRSSAWSRGSAPVGGLVAVLVDGLEA